MLPPNREVCFAGDVDTGVLPASSRHQGGAHVLMGEGAVVFITDSMEAGDTRHPIVRLNGGINTQYSGTARGSESPRGLWGALGMRAARETMEEQLNQWINFLLKVDDPNLYSGEGTLHAVFVHCRSVCRYRTTSINSDSFRTPSSPAGMIETLLG